jgi:hypothetical protein
MFSAEIIDHEYYYTDNQTSRQDSSRDMLLLEFMSTYPDLT